MAARSVQSASTRHPAGVAGAAPVERDWLIDLIRIGSVAVVIALHWLYLRVTVLDDVMHTELALGGPVFWALSWLLMVMPLFFLAGGFANTMVLDRLGRSGRRYGEFLAVRARRLLSPLLLLVAVTFAVVVAVSFADPGSAERMTARAGLHLWFVGVFLLCITLAPVALAVHDRHGWWVLPSVLLTGALLVDAARYSGNLSYEAARWPNLVLVWLFCHQMGILHARGTLARHSNGAILVMVGVCVAVLTAMVTAGPYAPVNVGMADAEATNLMPPNAALSVLVVAQLGLLTLLARRVAGRSPGQRVLDLIRWFNLRLVVIYLWHVPALAAVTFLGLLAPGLLLPADPTAWWLLRPFWIVMATITLWLLLKVALAWEWHVQQLEVRTHSGAALLAAVLGIAGVTVLWRAGIGPAAGPWLGGFCVLSATALLIRSPRRADLSS